MSEEEKINIDDLEDTYNSDVQSDPIEESEEQIEEELKSVPEVKDKAKKFGHLSKEDWVKQGRDPDKWKSEEEFVEFGDSYSKLRPHIDTLKKEISKRDTALDTMAQYIDEIRQREYQRGKQEVEERLRQAREMGDIQAVEDLTRKQAQFDAESRSKQISDAAKAQKEALEVFIDRNKHWFNDQHPDLQAKALQLGQQIRRLYPTISYADEASMIEERMKFEHADIVGSGQSRNNPITPSRSMVNKSAMDSSPVTEDRAFRSLSADQRSEFNYVKQMVEKVPGIKYTIKDYLKSSSKKRD